MNNSVAANVTVQEVHIPQMLTIKQVSELAQMSPYYVRRLCKTVPGLSVTSGRKYYVNVERLRDYLNGQ